MNDRSRDRSVRRSVRSRSSCLLQTQPSTIRHRLSPTPEAKPSELRFLPSPAHNGSAQLSYFIYSCTVRTQAQCHATAQSHHARMNSRPNVLCIRSTMSNSQRTIAKITTIQIDHSRFRSFSRGQRTGGAERDRTDDLLLAKQALSQLSYGPNHWSIIAQSGPEPALSNLVGQGRFELPTSRLSSARSNQLSY